MDEMVSNEIETTNLTTQATQEEQQEAYEEAILEQQQINNIENLPTQQNLDEIEEREVQENSVENKQTEQSTINQTESELKQEVYTDIPELMSADESERLHEESNQIQAQENQSNQNQIQEKIEEQEQQKTQMETQEEGQNQQLQTESNMVQTQINISENCNVPSNAAVDVQTEENNVESQSTDLSENLTTALNQQAYEHQEEVQQHSQSIMMETETIQDQIKTENIKNENSELIEDSKNQTEGETSQIDKGEVVDQPESNLEYKKDSHLSESASNYESEMNKDSDDDKNDLSTINVNSLNNIVSSLIESNSSSNMQQENSCDALSFMKNEQGETSFTNDTPVATGAGGDDEDDENSAVADVIAAVEQACAAKAAAGPQNTPTTPKSATKKKAAPKPSPSKTINAHSNNSLNSSINADGSSAQKRRKKDPLAPKAPLNGYLVYFNEERAEMRQKNPNIGFGELTKIIAAKWKELPNEEKQKYINEADLDKERYVKQMADYKKSDAYKQYQKDIVNAKMPRVDDANMNGLPASIQSNFPFYQQPGHLQSNQQEPNLNWLQQESQVAGFDIPIFTEEFIEHCKSREHEMRQLRKEIGELEQQNSVLHKHIENMQQSSIRMDNDIERVKNMNNQLQRNIDFFRQNILHYFNGTALPNSQDYPNSSNIDEYIMRMYSIVNQHEQNPNMNDPSYSFAMHAKSIISKINFNSLFEVA